MPLVGFGLLARLMVPEIRTSTSTSDLEPLAIAFLAALASLVGMALTRASISSGVSCMTCPLVDCLLVWYSAVPDLVKLIVGQVGV